MVRGEGLGIAGVETREDGEGKEMRGIGGVFLFSPSEPPVLVSLTADFGSVSLDF